MRYEWSVMKQEELCVQISKLSVELSLVWNVIRWQVVARRSNFASASAASRDSAKNEEMKHFDNKVRRLRQTEWDLEMF